VAFTVILDSNILYPAPVRDVFLELALSDLFRAKWSNLIHEEWIRSVLRDRKDIKRERLERTRDQMNAHVRDCVVSGFEHLIPTIKLKDPDDCHVVAAAVIGRADLIVTYNLKDFDEQVLKKFRLTVQHPDDFLMHLYSLANMTVVESVSRVRARLKNPPFSAKDYLETLRRHQLTDFAELLVAHLSEI